MSLQTLVCGGGSNVGDTHQVMPECINVKVSPVGDRSAASYRQVLPQNPDTGIVLASVLGVFKPRVRRASSESGRGRVWPDPAD
jgi:hypothetical protein